MTRRLVTQIISVLVIAICGIYTYLTIHDGGAISSPAPLGLYILYISFIYRRRAGWLVAILSWLIVDTLFMKPVGRFHIMPAMLMLIGWFILDVEVGHYAGKYKRWKDRELKKREMYNSIAAHELKTPITVMKVRVGLIEKKDPVLAHILNREIERLQTLIERMMNYSKISTGKYELVYTTFSLNELLTEVVDNTQNVHADAKLRTHLPAEDISIEADRIAIEQILINLLNNAVKHCPKKQIDATLKYKNRHWIQISIRDRGDGIPAEVRRKIFAPFVQGSNASPGLGMGLYIVRQLVDLHKGMVYFHSKLKGATFFVDLPINQKIKDTRAKYRI